MNNELWSLLNTLLDKYEKSKTFQGDNKIIQSIFIKPEKAFPSYLDDSQYEVFAKVNEAIRELEERKVVSTQRHRNGVVSKVTLNIEHLEEGYQLCKRTSKKDIHRQLYELWEELIDNAAEEPFTRIVNKYKRDQEGRIKTNKQVAYFDGDFQTYREMFQVIREIIKNDSEQFVRDFSVRVLGNSKKLESMEEKIRSFLFEYGECSKKEEALEEYGIVKTPTNVSMKGKAILWIGDQKLDLSKLQGDISFSSVSLAEITCIEITGERIVTIENLTSFHSFCNQDCFVIYLGGYHNSIKRNFLKRLYENNREKKYVHFGDIDAGGFYIYEHLVNRTGIPFELYRMDVTALLKYRETWQELTANDRKRIHALLNKEGTEIYREVLGFMLENNCKLEQEAVQ